MFCAPLVQLDITPPLGAITGSLASNTILDQINAKWGNPTGVIFGQPGDPYADRYHALNTLMGNVRSSELAVQQVVEVINHPNRYRPITCQEELRTTPVSMQLPILMYQPVRTLFEDERIQGYGFEKENLPAEDFYGRLIHNGEAKMLPSYPGEELPEDITWAFDGMDPDLDWDDLDAIETTRNYIDSWLQEQMGPGGDRLDPTDISNKISKAKTKKK